MRHDQFKINGTFFTANGDLEWVCTDIGTRVITGVRADDLKRYPEGPPYSVAEFVFDEYDLPGCETRKTAV
jgi:hypothetical protein